MPNSTGMIPVWSPSKIIQTVLISCISKTHGQKIGFQNIIFKNLYVQNYKAQSFHIWYITSSQVLYQSCSNYATKKTIFKNFLSKATKAALMFGM